MSWQMDDLETALHTINKGVGMLRMLKEQCEVGERALPKLNHTQARWLELDRQEIEAWQQAYQKMRAA